MPDSTGWPTRTEVRGKAELSSALQLSGRLDTSIISVLAAVIAEFQSPPGYDGSGGTGRRFDTVTETRTFDGSGYAEQPVSDIVPGTPLTVSAFGNLLSTVIRPSYDGQGYNALVLAGGISGGYYGGCQAVFPLGVQNISVTTTWGFAGGIPADVYEAVLCEAASRVLVQCCVPLTGVGEEIHLEEFEIITSSGISVWDKSSPIAIYHAVYLSTVKRYRLGNSAKLKQIAMSRRMS